LNLLTMIIFRRDLRRINICVKTIRTIVRFSISYARALSGTTLALHGTTYFTTHSLGLAAGAAAGAASRLFVQLHSLYLSLINPVLPTLSHAIASHDMSWVKKTLGLIAIVMPLSLATSAALFAIFGADIIELWLEIEFPGGPVATSAFA